MLETNARKSQEKAWSCSDPSGSAGFYFSLSPLRAAVRSMRRSFMRKRAVNLEGFFFGVWISLQLCTKLLGRKALCVGRRASGLDKCRPGLFLVTCSQPFPEDGRVRCFHM